MGSKNLKAVLVKGSKSMEVYDHEAFNSVVAECEEYIRSYPAWEAWKRAGSMGTRGTSKDWNGLDYDKIANPYLKKGEDDVYCPCMMGKGEVERSHSDT